MRKSLCMQAVMATWCGLPACLRRAYSIWRTGLCRTAVVVAMSKQRSEPATPDGLWRRAKGRLPD